MKEAVKMGRFEALNGETRRVEEREGPRQEGGKLRRKKRRNGGGRESGDERRRRGRKRGMVRRNEGKNM